jgi:hypothetical protein
MSVRKKSPETNNCARAFTNCKELSATFKRMTDIPPHNSFKNAQELGASARAAPRDSLFLVGTMTFDGQGEAHSIRIRNLSATGMMAEGKALGHVGQKVVIEIKTLGRISGSIAWIAASRMGIAFDSEIDPQVARQPVGKHVHEMPDFLRSQPSGRPGMGFKS